MTLAGHNSMLYGSLRRVRLSGVMTRNNTFIAESPIPRLELGAPPRLLGMDGWVSLATATHSRAYRLRKKQRDSSRDVTQIKIIQYLLETVTSLSVTLKSPPPLVPPDGFPLDSLPFPPLIPPSKKNIGQFAFANGHADARPPPFAKDFEEWWKAYPHKVGKIAALKAFQKVRRAGITLDMLLEGVSRYVANKPDDRPWCNPATWLNQGRWDDDEQQHQANGHANHKHEVSLIEPISEAEAEDFKRRIRESFQRGEDAQSEL